MPSLDIFNDDAFSAVSLTNAINTTPEGQRVPTLLDALFDQLDDRLAQHDADAIALFAEHEAALLSTLGPQGNHIARQLERFDFDGARETLRDARRP